MKESSKTDPFSFRAGKGQARLMPFSFWAGKGQARLILFSAVFLLSVLSNFGDVLRSRWLIAWLLWQLRMTLWFVTAAQLASGADWSGVRSCIHNGSGSWPWLLLFFFAACISYQPICFEALAFAVKFWILAESRLPLSSRSKFLNLVGCFLHSF